MLTPGRAILTGGSWYLVVNEKRAYQGAFGHKKTTDIQRLIIIIQTMSIGKLDVTWGLGVVAA
jgi:hypothetical protein